MFQMAVERVEENMVDSGCDNQQEGGKKIERWRGREGGSRGFSAGGEDIV